MSSCNAGTGPLNALQLEFRLLSPTVAFFLKHAVHLEHLAELGWPSAFADRLVERCLRDYAVSQAWLPDGDSQIFRSYVFGPSGWKDNGSAMLRCKI